jgi:hypothetical protein
MITGHGSRLGLVLVVILRSILIDILTHHSYWPQAFRGSLVEQIKQKSE